MTFVKIILIILPFCVLNIFFNVGSPKEDTFFDHLHGTTPQTGFDPPLIDDISYEADALSTKPPWLDTSVLNIYQL